MIATVKRTPNELRRDDCILVDGKQARINIVLNIRPGVVQVLALTEDARLIEPVFDRLVDCVVNS